MPDDKSIKHQITEVVLSQLPDEYKSYAKHPIDFVIFKMWQTGRLDGLRLTEDGLKLFELAEIQHYDFDFKQEGQSYYKFVLDLNKKMKCPYYLGVKKPIRDKVFYIRVYDNKVAMFLGLYGSIHEYLSSIKID